MEIDNIQDMDFIESQGRFSINPSQVTDIKYFNNALYFYFNGSGYASMRIKFTCEEHARISLEGFKQAVLKKLLEECNRRI